MKVPNCPFCFIESQSTTLSPELDWHSVKSRTLSRVHDISLCAGLGAIVEPYIVAFTHEHCVASTEIENATRSNLLDALDLCLASGLFPSGSLCVFEHGGRSPENSTACLEHCHLHIVDGRFDLQSGFAAEFPKVETVKVTETENFVADSSYLFAGIYDGNRAIRGFLARSPGCGSQFFRRLLADQVGNTAWNWRLSPTPEAAFCLRDKWVEQRQYPVKGILR